MSRLRKEKRRLESQIEVEKVELYAEVEKYKNSLWPFKVLARFRKTAESLSENKLLIIGAQLAYAALNAAKEKKSANEESDSKSGIVNFLKEMAMKFVENYTKPKEEKE